MISVVMSLMWFVVKWCICCCVLFVFRNVAQGVLSQVLFSVACWSMLKRSSISTNVLEGVLVNAERLVGVIECCSRVCV